MLSFSQVRKLRYDLIAEKEGQRIKVELKAIDLKAIQAGKAATQHVSANEIVCSSHLIITVFDHIELKANHIMSIRQFVEDSGVEKYKKYKDYESFLAEYAELAKQKSMKRKNSPAENERLDFDFSFNPRNVEKWSLAKYKDQWDNLERSGN